MLEFKNLTKEQMIEAVRRNQRMGIKQKNTSEQVQVNEYASFLEWYAFNRLNTQPQTLSSTIQNQFYAEQNFRDRRQRNIDFTRGRHFSEPVWDSEIKAWITQWQYLRRRNIPPLTYNVISKFNRSLVGQFREINTGNVVKCDSRDDRGNELATYLTVCLDRIKNKNKGKSKDAMNFKESLLCGRPVFKAMWSSKNNLEKTDVKFRIVNPSKFMVNPGVVDYDLDNLHSMTEIVDASLEDIIATFADGDYEKGQQIKKSYIQYQGDARKLGLYNYQTGDGSQLRNMSFFVQNNAAYRYFEHWVLISDYEAITYDPMDPTGIPTAHKWENIDKVKKAVDEENASRKINAEGLPQDVDYMIRFKANYVSRWYVIYLTPFGSVLSVKESPYQSGKPPYVFMPPDINGEYWGITEELLNAQLGLDRQILQADAIVANASKGVWLVPDTAIPDDMSKKEYLTEIKKVDGAVVYKVREGAEDLLPKQFYANSANVASNVQQLIHLYSNLVDEISGNYGAAQGRDSSTKTATGYALESQNAGLNVRDIMENYLTLLVERDELLLWFILEGYTRSDYEKIIGIPIDPKEFKLFEFSIEQSKGTNSPAHRLILEQQLLDLVLQQLLPFEVFMEVSNNPIMIQAKQKFDEWKKNNGTMQQLPTGAPGSMPIPAEKQMLMAQGHPQAGLLKEQAVKQELPQLSGLK